MAKLQKPPYVYMNGRLTKWDDARIHVASEALIRGISVFEGIKGYWSHDNGDLALLALEAHFQRFRRSALLQHLPMTMTFEQFRDACSLLTRELMDRERDLWLRPTLYSVEGHWGEDTVADVVISCYLLDKKRPDPIAVGVSTWRRPSDACMPTRIKSAANYQTSRIARIEGRRQGFADMILLNSSDRVAEATGSCVLMVKNGCVVTPPPYEGCLESITVDIVEGLCESLGIGFERRPLDRSELLVSDEIALAGTLMELAVVKRIESRDMPEHSPVFDRLSNEYWACIRGERHHPAVRLTSVLSA